MVDVNYGETIIYKVALRPYLRWWFENYDYVEDEDYDSFENKMVQSFVKDKNSKVRYKEEYIQLPVIFTNYPGWLSISRTCHGKISKEIMDALHDYQIEHIETSEICGPNEIEITGNEKIIEVNKDYFRVQHKVNYK